LGFINEFLGAFVVKLLRINAKVHKILCALVLLLCCYLLFGSLLRCLMKTRQEWLHRRDIQNNKNNKEQGKTTFDDGILVFYYKNRLSNLFYVALLEHT